MDYRTKKVVGVYEDRMEAVNELQRLKELGYTQSDISVYTSPERAKTVEGLMGHKVEDVKVARGKEDMGWWETIMNSFNFYSIGSDESNNRIRSIDYPDRTGLTPEAQEAIQGGSTEEMRDFLTPYADDIRKDKLVIVVNNYGRHEDPQN